MKYNHRLDKVRNHIQQFFANKDVTPLIYHNLVHTEFVVSSAAKIANHYGLDDRDSFIVGTAAWFHDTGYYNGPALRHEERGADLAAAYLSEDGIDPETIEAVRGCIIATHMPQNPKNLLEQIVADADLFHFGTDDFPKKNKLVRKEMEVRLGMEIDKDKWREKTILMMEKHTYHTDYCRTTLTPTKEKNIAKLKEKAEKAIETKEVEIAAEPVKEHHHEGKSEGKSEAKKDKSDRPDKGIETMFRISFQQPPATERYG